MSDSKVSAIAFSLLVHVAALGLVALSLTHQPAPLAGGPARVETVEAVAVDEARVEAELRQLKGQEQSRRDAEEARQKRLQQELDQARKAKQEEDKRLAVLKKQREQDERDAEQQRKQLAELKTQQAEVEKRRQAEQQRLLEAQKKRQAEEAAAAQRQLAAKMAAEEKRLAAELKRQQASRYANQYMSAIQAKVRSNWLRPEGSAGKFECKVMVKQSTQGEVLSAQVTKSCGNPALDRSVEAAVRKSSPLPEPLDPTVFDTDLEFIFSPGDQ